MPDLPQHPENNEPSSSKRGPVKVIVGIAIAVGTIAVFAFLHVSGSLGPGQH